ncbi:MAG: hypothetical protein IPJ03_02770 [Ignavibacteriales bacterium]|nr:hypothetical protein [Ignavibacteriales bacterium]
MKKLIPIFVFFITVVCFSQNENLDKMELRDGKVFMGKVEKIKTEIVEFRESETDLVYETEKKDIRYIQLVGGKILTFEEEYNVSQQNESQIPQSDRMIVEKDDGAPVGLIILATVGVVLLTLIIIGAAAQ